MIFGAGRGFAKNQRITLLQKDLYYYKKAGLLSHTIRQPIITALFGYILPSLLEYSCNSRRLLQQQKGIAVEKIAAF